MICGPPVSRSSLKESSHLAAIAYRRRTDCSPASCRFAAAIPYELLSDASSLLIATRMFAKLRDCLSTARLVDPDLTESLVESLGGEQVLFDLFRDQIPWTTPPIIEPAGAHGRTVRSNWYQAAEQHQSDPHETVCEICETLIALSPNSDAAASDAVDPMGRTMAIGDFKPWSKNMPRANIPAKARVAWNVAFRQILLARATADSLTN